MGEVCSCVIFKVCVCVGGLVCKATCDVKVKEDEGVVWLQKRWKLKKRMMN